MNDGVVTVIFRGDNSALRRTTADSEKALGELSVSGDKSFNSLSKSSLISATFIGNVFAKAFSSVVSTVTNSISAAVQRVDTLNNFPKVMANLGFAAEDSAKVISDLSDKLRGLPTSLDTGAAAVQRLATSSKDIKKAEQWFLALNDAVLAGAAPMGLQTEALEQFTQMIAVGIPDIQAWKTVVRAMPAQMDMLARSMGYVSGEVGGDLYEAFQKGAVSTEMLMGAFTKLDTEGGDSITSFAQQAKDATGGMNTGFANMQNAINRSIAVVIGAIGSSNINSLTSGIGSAFESVGKSIANVINFVKDNEGVFGALAAGVAGAVVAVSALSIQTKLAMAAQAAFNIVATANPIGLIIVAVAGLVAGLVYLQQKFGIFNGIIQTAKEVLQPLIDAFQKYLWPVLQQIGAFIGGIFARAWESITKAFNELMKALQPIMPALKIIGVLLLVAILAPIVAVVAAILLVISVIVAVVTALVWFAGVIADIFTKGTEIARDFGTNLGKFIREAVDNVVGFFNSIPTKVKGVVDTVVGFFAGMGKTIGDFIGSAFKSVINGALKLAENFLNGPINLINGALDIINKIPGVHIDKITKIALPRMAMGGIVSSPTATIIGEAGTEAVMPLENNTGWITELARELNDRGGSGGGPQVYQTVNAYSNYDVDVANRDLFRLARRAAV